jgi:hypothetical protein
MQLQVPIGSMPVNLILVLDGRLAFVRVAQFNTIVCAATAPGDIPAVFNFDDFTIGDTKYSYDMLYAYKEIPEMKQWLVNQNLVMPQIY